MSRQPQPLGLQEGKDLGRSVNDQLIKMGDSQFILPSLLSPNNGKFEPPTDYKRTGLLAYANGSDWNPSQGTKAIVMWNGAAWVAPINVFGDLAGGHYSQFESDGTLKMTAGAKVWKDVFFPMSPPKATGAGNPTLTTWNTPLRGYSFAVNDAHDFDPQEFPHDGAQGLATASWHIHWVSRTNVAGARGVKWQLEYAQSNVGSAFPAPTTINAEETVAANTAVNTHYLTSLGTFTTGNIASHMTVRLTRITAAGTAPADNPVVLGVHYHYEVDTIGSRDIVTK